MGGTSVLRATGLLKGCDAILPRIVPTDISFLSIQV